VPLLVLLCSCFIGVGAAVLWTAQTQCVSKSKGFRVLIAQVEHQRRYMTQNTVVENRCCPRASTLVVLNQKALTECGRGLWTGIFWGLFQMCIIPGDV
jgi:hypothetical protein